MTTAVNVNVFNRGYADSIAYTGHGLPLSDTSKSYKQIAVGS